MGFYISTCVYHWLYYFVPYSLWKDHHPHIENVLYCFVVFNMESYILEIRDRMSYWNYTYIYYSHIFFLFHFSPFLLFIVHHTTRVLMNTCLSVYLTWIQFFLSIHRLEYFLSDIESFTKSLTLLCILCSYYVCS